MSRSSPDRAELLRARARELARPLDPPQSPGHGLLVLTSGDARYAVPSDRVSEVLPLRGVAHLPRAAGAASAVVGVSGGIVALLDPARLVEGGNGARITGAWGVVIEWDGRRVCLAADRVALDELPAETRIVTADGGASDVVRGLTADGTLVLAPAAIVAAVEAKG